MTATHLSVPTTTDRAVARPAPPAARSRILPAGVASGVAASAATTAVAAAAHGVGVPLTIGGKTIPLVGFAQLTFAAVVVGTILAAGLARHASHPRSTFVTTTVALTLLSIVPDVLVDAYVATKLALALTHVVAAAIVIPAVASRLSD